MSNEVLSQEQIEAMLSQAGQIDKNDEEPSLNVDDYLTRDEQDLLGEVGNICMGTSATTMSTLLNRKVLITTPNIFIHTMESLSKEYPAPIIVADVSYTKGLDGDNLLILKEYDVALITNSLLGEEEEIDPDNIELNEIHLSAIGEVMNQMIGSSANALADILHRTIDISTPLIKKLVLNEDQISNSFKSDEMLVKINFHMEIEGLLRSEIMQVIPMSFAKEMARTVMEEMSGGAQEVAPVHTANAAQNEPEPIEKEQPLHIQEQPSSHMAAHPAAQSSHNVIKEQQSVSVQSAQFPSFNNGQELRNTPFDNIDMLLDVPMRVTVELGKSKKTIKEILEFNMGSVIVLDKIAGDPIDILVNGKKIGRGEVVVIDENYGVRITEINMPAASELMKK